MSEFEPKNFKMIAKEMPNCCANCTHNQWDENGCHCRNEENFTLADGEEEIDWYEREDGEIEWSNVCDNHNRGNPFN